LWHSADVEIPQGGANGVILAQGGKFGGWSIYLKDGKPTYQYNWLGLERYTLGSDKPVPPGKATIRFEFAYDGGGLGKGGTGRILLNGTEIAKGRIDKTQCCVIALDETADVGKANGTPASNEYDVPFAFTGTIDRVVISLEGTGAAGVDAKQAADEAKLKKATLSE
jgi:arylsulfatase